MWLVLGPADRPGAPEAQGRELRVDLLGMLLQALESRVRAMMRFNRPLATSYGGY